MIVYHSTPAANCAAIERDGLKPDTAARWGVEPIHLAIDQPMDFLVADCHEVDDNQVVTYRVDMRGIQVSPGADGWPTLACYQPIPASRLIRIT